VQSDNEAETATDPKIVYSPTMTTLSQECQPATERFGARGAVVPQKILCEIERLSPAGNLVEAPPAPSRHPVVRREDDVDKAAVPKKM